MVPGPTMPTPSLWRGALSHVGRRTDVGRRREINEDSLLALDLFWDQPLVRARRGCSWGRRHGGHKGGEIASGCCSPAGPVVDEWLPGMIEAPDEPAVWSDWLWRPSSGATPRYSKWSRQAGFEMGNDRGGRCWWGDQAYIAHVGIVAPIGERRWHRAADGRSPLVESLVPLSRLARGSDITRSPT